MANEQNDEVLNFFNSLGKDLISRKITGAAYSERGGDSVITLNLINEANIITAFHIPLDLQALNKDSGEKTAEK